MLGTPDVIAIIEGDDLAEMDSAIDRIADFGEGARHRFEGRAMDRLRLKREAAAAGWSGRAGLLGGRAGRGADGRARDCHAGAGTSQRKTTQLTSD